MDEEAICFGGIVSGFTSKGIANQSLFTKDKNGSALKARLSNPQDIMLYKNEMYISDTGNACVKKLSKGKVTTLISAFSMGDGREPAEPCGLMIQGGKLYIGDIFTEELIEFEL